MKKTWRMGVSSNGCVGGAIRIAVMNPTKKWIEREMVSFTCHFTKE